MQKIMQIWNTRLPQPVAEMQPPSQQTRWHDPCKKKKNPPSPTFCEFFSTDYFWI